MAGTQFGGTGKDADGGKGRTQFEDTRRGGNSGSPDRPPIYKPVDDGERNGYVNRSRGGVGTAPKPTPKLRGRRLVVGKNAKRAARQRLGM